LFTTADQYDYLISGEAMSKLEAFIADEKNTYEQYIEVCSLYVVSAVYL